MIKACLLAFGSGVFFFLLILQSAWWLIPGVLTWTVIFYWQDRQERRREAFREFGSHEPEKTHRR